MLRFAKDMLLTFILGLSLYALGLLTCGCAPATLSQAGAYSPAITGASVVTLVRPAVSWTWGSLASEQGLTNSGFKLRYERSCNAFAIPGNQLVTAAHCVAGIEPGGDVRYLSPDGVGHGIATLLSVNEAADLATCAAYGLTPLPVTSPPRAGETVLSVSSYYGQTSYGAMRNRLSSGYYETTQTITHGWSGSPVLDTQGRVWGVVSQGIVDNNKPENFEPGRAIIAALQ